MEESSLLLKTKNKAIPGERIVVPSGVSNISSFNVITRTVNGWRGGKFGYQTTGGGVWGSFWMGATTGDSNFHNALRHCFPSQQEYEDCLTSNRQMYFNVRQTAGRSSYPSVSRNGFASASWGSYADSTIVDEFVYVDKNGQLIGMHPYLGTGPTTNVVLL